MITKINRPCWLKYCQPGTSSVPAPGQDACMATLCGGVMMPSDRHDSFDHAGKRGLPVGTVILSNHGRH